MKSLIFFQTILALLLTIPGMDSNTKTRLSSADTVAITAVAHGEYFVKTEVVVGGSQAVLIDGQTEYTKGITNIDKGRIKQVAQITHLQFGYASATNVSNPVLAEQLFRQDPTGSVANSTLIIKQGSKELLRVPVLSLANFGNFNPSERWVALDVPVHLNNSQELEVVLEFPAGASAVADSKEYIYLNMRGPRTNA